MSGEDEGVAVQVHSYPMEGKLRTLMLGVTPVILIEPEVFEGEPMVHVHLSNIQDEEALHILRFITEVVETKSKA